MLFKRWKWLRRTRLNSNPKYPNPPLTLVFDSLLVCRNIFCKGVWKYSVLIAVIMSQYSESKHSTAVNLLKQHGEFLSDKHSRWQTTVQWLISFIRFKKAFEKQTQNIDGVPYISGAIKTLRRWFPVALHHTVQSFMPVQRVLILVQNTMGHILISVTLGVTPRMKSKSLVLQCDPQIICPCICTEQYWSLWNSVCVKLCLHGSDCRNGA